MMKSVFQVLSDPVYEVWEHFGDSWSFVYQVHTSSHTFCPSLSHTPLIWRPFSSLNLLCTAGQRVILMVVLQNSCYRRRSTSTLALWLLRQSFLSSIMQFTLFLHLFNSHTKSKKIKDRKKIFYDPKQYKFYSDQLYWFASIYPEALPLRNLKWKSLLQFLRSLL